MNYCARTLLLSALCVQLGLSFHAVATPQPQAAEASKASVAGPLAPGANDWRIALTTVRMLEQFHYLHLTMEPAFANKYNYDPNLSAKFFDMYVNTLDPQHIHFLQSDLAEFSTYRTNLNALTRREHDTKPAFTVFNRFL